MKVSFQNIEPNQTYRIRGHRHFGSNGLELYKTSNPAPAMYAARFLKIGVLQTGDYCRVLKISLSYTQIKAAGETGWVHTHTFQCSILKQSKI